MGPQKKFLRQPGVVPECQTHPRLTIKTTPSTIGPLTEPTPHPSIATPPIGSHATREFRENL